MISFVVQGFFNQRVVFRSFAISELFKALSLPFFFSFDFKLTKYQIFVLLLIRRAESIDKEAIPLCTEIFFPDF